MLFFGGGGEAFILTNEFQEKKEKGKLEASIATERGTFSAWTS